MKRERTPHLVLTNEQVDRFGEFWKSIWEVPAEHNLPCPGGMVSGGQRADPDDTPIGWEEAWEKALAKMAGWKAPGPNRIEAYWWKSLRGPAGVLKEMLGEMHRNERDFPEWLVRGRTIMIPKSGCKGAV